MKDLSSRLAGASLALSFLLALAACDTSRSRDGRSDVVLISIDCLNQRQFEHALRGGYAPAFAALARDSVSFSRAYAHAPWTTPSHVSMLSGLYPSQHGRDLPWGLMLESNDRFDWVPRFPSLPGLLAAAGYETAAFVGEGSTSARFGLGEGFARFHESARNEDKTDLPETLAALARWLAERPEAPFFLFLHTFDFHDPRPGADPSDAAGLAYIDRQLGPFLAELKRLGRYDGALIVFTGDHGSRMIRTQGKCCVHGAGHYEENLKVPLLLKLPGSRRVGTSARLVRHVDLLPTVLDVLELPGTAYEGPGRSLLEVLRDEGAARHSYSEADGRCALRQALVTERFKYIYTAQDARQERLRALASFNSKRCRACPSELPQEELYDLRTDPFEENDLLRGEPGPEATAALPELRRVLREHLVLEPRYTRRPREQPADAGLDADLEQALRSLGYIE